MNYWFRLLAKLKLYECDGNSFQRFVEDLLQYIYPDYQAVSPYGSWGDGGNDGWVESQGIYFQVYGPKSTSESSYTAPQAIQKAQRDFETLKSNQWQNLQEYHFVLNTRNEGVPAPLIQTIQQIKSLHNLSGAKVIGGRDLINIFDGLTKDQKENIVNGVPNLSLEAEVVSCIGQLLQHLTFQNDGFSSFLHQTLPVFDEKIKLNGLSGLIVQRLTEYSSPIYCDSVDLFLNTEVGLAQEAATQVQQIYQESKSKIPNEDEDCANLRYMWMVEKLIPPSIKHPHSIKAYRQAAMIVLAKYFITCDVYEHPDNFVTA